MNDDRYRYGGFKLNTGGLKSHKSKAKIKTEYH